MPVFYYFGFVSVLFNVVSRLFKLWALSGPCSPLTVFIAFSANSPLSYWIALSRLIVTGVAVSIY